MALPLKITIFIISTVNIFDYASAMIPSVNEYFPDIKGNSARLQWSHATNSKSLLKEALADKTVHMLEADVVYGTLLNGSGPMPIMGHPPANTSDLSLEEFINAIVTIQSTHKKGMKLDFKYDKAYNASWPIIKQNKLTFPVWINADLLVGPGNPTSVPLDAQNFVSSAKNHLPDSTLSIGWTTNYADHLSYTQEMLDEMLHLVMDEKIRQPITLAVRAAFTANSPQRVQNLVESIDRFQENNTTSLTIWMSSRDDVVDTGKLHTLLVNLGRPKVFLDTPPDIKKKILGGNSSPITVAHGALVAVLSAVSVTLSKMLNIL